MLDYKRVPWGHLGQRAATQSVGRVSGGSIPNMDETKKKRSHEVLWVLTTIRDLLIYSPDAWIPCVRRWIVSSRTMWMINVSCRLSLPAWSRAVTPANAAGWKTLHVVNRKLTSTFWEHTMFPTHKSAPVLRREGRCPLFVVKVQKSWNATKSNTTLKYC